MRLCLEDVLRDNKTVQTKDLIHMCCLENYYILEGVQYVLIVACVGEHGYQMLQDMHIKLSHKNGVKATPPSVNGRSVAMPRKLPEDRYFGMLMI